MASGICDPLPSSRFSSLHAGDQIEPLCVPSVKPRFSGKWRSSRLKTSVEQTSQCRYMDTWDSAQTLKDPRRDIRCGGYRVLSAWHWFCHLAIVVLPL